MLSRNALCSVGEIVRHNKALQLVGKIKVVTGCGNF